MIIETRVEDQEVNRKGENFINDIIFNLNLLKGSIGIA